MYQDQLSELYVLTAVQTPYIQSRVSSTDHACTTVHGTGKKPVRRREALRSDDSGPTSESLSLAWCHSLISYYVLRSSMWVTYRATARLLLQLTGLLTKDKRVAQGDRRAEQHRYGVQTSRIRPIAFDIIRDVGVSGLVATVPPQLHPHVVNVRGSRLRPV